jgi:hypothetical protein
VSRDEFQSTITQRAPARFDRLMVEMPLQVTSEISRRGVSATALLLQGHKHDVVKISRQTAAQFLWFPLAGSANEFWRDGSAGRAVSVGRYFDSIYCRA